VSTYNDPFISLKDITLTQFESARDVPASIDLIVKESHQLDIQARTILIKMHAALTNFKVPKIAVAVGIREFSIFNTILSFLHGDKKDRIIFFGHNPIDLQVDSPVTREIMQNFPPENFLLTETEICRSLLKQDAFIIGLFSSPAVNEAREILDAFSHDRSGLLFLHNYSRLNSPSHHLYAAERNLRVLELPEGSGECYSIQMK
jgi:hypothetical protein